MATFNPELQQQQPPSFLNYSRGWKDDSVGDLMGGIGNLFTMGVKIKDDKIKQDIKTEARVRIDETQDRSIAELHSVTRGDGPPPEIAQAVGRLSKQKEAALQGSARESNYWGAIDSTARMLRARYPGYRDHIDDVMKDLTGSIPANALVRSLRADYQSMTSGAKDPYGDLIKTMSGEGTLPPDWRDQKKWSYENLISWRGETMSRKFWLEMQGKTLTNEEAQGRRDDKGVKQVMQVDFGGFLRTAGAGTVFAENTERFREATEAGSDMTPEQERQARDSAGVLTRELKNQFERFITQPGKIGQQSYLERVGPEGIVPLRTFIDAKIKDINEAVYNKDWGSAYRAATDIRLLSDNTKLNLMTDPHFRAVAATRETLGPEVATAYMSNARFKTAVDRAVSEAATVRMGNPSIAGQTSLLAEMTKAQNMGEDNPRTYDAIINDAVFVVSHPKTKPETRKALVEAMYGDRNTAFLNFIKADKDPAQQHKVFNAMANAGTAQAIHKASQELGDPTMWSKYQKWVVNQTYALNAITFNTVSKAQLDLLGADIKYDPTSMSFEVRPRSRAEMGQEAGRMMLPGAMGEPGLGPRQAVAALAIEQWRASGIDQTVGRLNASLAPLREIAKLNGYDGNQFMSNVLYEMNLKATSQQGRQGWVEPWFGSLNRAVDKGTETWARLWAQAQRNRIKPGMPAVDVSETGVLSPENARAVGGAAIRGITPQTQFPDTNPERSLVSPQTRSQAQWMLDYFKSWLPESRELDKARSRQTLGVE